MVTVKSPLTQAEIFALAVEKKFKEITQKSSVTTMASPTKTLAESVRFMLDSIAEAMSFAQGAYTVGTDKKEFVMAVIRRVYDTVIGPNLPYWLYPFSSLIKSLVIDQLVSNFIDWAVLKYKDGSWGKL